MRLPRPTSRPAAALLAIVSLALSVQAHAAPRGGGALERSATAAARSAPVARLTTATHGTARNASERALLLRANRALARTKLVGPYANPRESLPASAGARPIVFGVMGGAGAGTPVATQRLVRRMGRAVAREGGVVLTGACPGLPHDALQAAKEEGALTIGISPWANLRDHVVAGSPTDGFDVLQFTELPPALRGQSRANFMGREVDNIERSDVILVAGGRFGTLGELAIALDERKPVGVLLGTGGITDVVRDVVAASTKAGKPPGAPVLYDRNPARLVKRLALAKARQDASGKRGPLGDHADPHRAR